MMVGVGCLARAAAQAPAPEPAEAAPPSGPDASARAQAPAESDVAESWLRTNLRPGEWRIQTDFGPIDSPSSGLVLGEPWTSAVGAGGSVRQLPSTGVPWTSHSLTAEAVAGIGPRVDLGVRACAYACDPSATLLGLTVRASWATSATSSFGLRAQALTFGPRQSVVGLGISYQSLRGRVAWGLAPEISARVTVDREGSNVEGETDQLGYLAGASLPVLVGYVHPRFRVGGHLGVGLIAAEERFSFAMPAGVDGSVILVDREVTLEATASIGYSLYVGDVNRVDPRYALGLRVQRRRR